MKIIDSHCHVYPDQIADRASSSIGTFYHEPICFDGKVSTLLREEHSSGISLHILSSVATTPHQVASINRFIADSVQQHPEKFLGLGSVHPDTSDPEEDFRQIRELGLKGIKIHPDFQQTSVADPRFLRIFALCEREKLPVLCHCGDDRYAYSNPVQILEVLSRFPDLILIGAHFGGWTVWRGAVAELFDQKKLYVTARPRCMPSAGRKRLLLSASSAQNAFFSEQIIRCGPLQRKSKSLTACSSRTRSGSRSSGKTPHPFSGFSLTSLEDDSLHSFLPSGASPCAEDA